MTIKVPNKSIYIYSQRHLDSKINKGQIVLQRLNVYVERGAISFSVTKKGKVQILGTISFYLGKLGQITSSIK